MEYQQERKFTDEEIQRLYDSVGWSAYTKDMTLLRKAIQGSTWVYTCRKESRLIALVRVISDDASIMYLQDVLVDPEFHRKGIGRRLLNACLQRFHHVRQKVLLTDDAPEQHRFYQAVGFSNMRELTKHSLNAYIRIEGVDLT